jgi:hypothetical protein
MLAQRGQRRASAKDFMDGPAAALDLKAAKRREAGRGAAL